ncbi:unnamed protein product [Calicophoron daubneyi]|uniref:Leptin receptor n=1 Tax=Calicophoron daubneyi TaxID=300641 RepID=A0AAV2T075_CALDB
MKCQTEDEESMNSKRENELWSLQSNVNDISGTSSTQPAESSVKGSSTKILGKHIYLQGVYPETHQADEEQGCELETNANTTEGFAHVSVHLGLRISHFDASSIEFIV